jgi:hypothetical protein
MTNDPLQKLLEGPPLEATAFAPNSRYHGLGTLRMPLPDGTSAIYVKRRFIPQQGNFTVLSVHRVIERDRLDNIAFRYLGDPDLFWRIADANGVLDSEVLTETVGNEILITLPEGM